MFRQSRIRISPSSSTIYLLTLFPFQSYRPLPLSTISHRSKHSQVALLLTPLCPQFIRSSFESRPDLSISSPPPRNPQAFNDGHELPPLSDWCPHLRVLDVPHTSRNHPLDDVSGKHSTTRFNVPERKALTVLQAFNGQHGRAYLFDGV